MRQLPLGVRIPDRAVFASFLTAHNGEAVEHLKAVARGSAAGTSFICGPTGAGKSHLLQATCVLASESMRAGYFPLAELRPLGIEALEGLPQLDCICLDDLEAVAGDGTWERALFGLYREIEERGARLVAATQLPPAFTAWALADLLAVRISPDESIVAGTMIPAEPPCQSDIRSLTVSEAIKSLLFAYTVAE